MSLDIWLYLEVDAGGPEEANRITLLSKNITHNLTGLWRHVGVYETLYHSEGKTAADILPNLEVAVDHMLEKPDECQTFDSPNGWGTYKDALPWLQEMVAGCRRYPKALIGVSR